MDLSKQKIGIHCPSCDFLNYVTLRQVQIRDVIICRGCKANIQLEDHLNTVRKALRSIRRELANLMKQLNDISNITIRF